MKPNNLYLLCILWSLFCAGCDEGSIYPDKTIDTGHTATVTVTFTGLDAWPEENTLSLCAFKEDRSTPVLSKRITKPGKEGRQTTLQLNNLPPDTKTIELVVISRGLKVVYSYYSYPIDGTETETKIAVGEVDLANFHRIQSQVFDLNCLSCHGGSSTLAGGLDLRDAAAYQALVNVKAPLSPEEKNYVTPETPENSYLLDILEENPYHKDMFNSSGKQEVLGLIETWIKRGASDN